MQQLELVRVPEEYRSSKTPACAEERAAEYEAQLLAEWGPGGRNRLWCRQRARAAYSLLARGPGWQPDEPSAAWRASRVHLEAMTRAADVTFRVALTGGEE